MELGNWIFGISRGEYPMPRNAGYEALLYELFEAVVAHLNKEYPEEREWVNTGYGTDFRNDIFEIHPYYWGDCTCSREREMGEEFEGDHRDECLLLRPNFLYKSTGYEIMWYKYPLRDSYASEEMPLLEFADMIKKCIESL